ncbi:SGNH hydrolase domain-containing protein [Rhodococcus pyridinivorans]|uniref:SGNH hydrolase domain-containing protein n=1 Tax=Rhodococcus pyridinivorans TaxID=103816 RepID=UPI00128ED07A|nr:SGNH hydrolase domain-containing protein [Rhodococcus pyridinivorans]
MESEWQAALERTKAKIPDDTRTVVIGDGPEFSVAPTMCLSMNLSSVSKCHVSASDVINMDRIKAERKAAATAGVQFIDTQEWYCPDGVCTAQRGDIALYRDNHHITVEHAQALAPALQAALGVARSRP